MQTDSFLDDEDRVLHQAKVIKTLQGVIAGQNVQSETLRGLLDSARAEVQRLRSELERPHDHGPKPKESLLEFTIGDGDMKIADLEGRMDQAMERIATLEGRVQGITEIVKQNQDDLLSRVKVLEEKVNRPSLVQESIDALSNRQPVQVARNPFEDLRPPRGL